MIVRIIVGSDHGGWALKEDLKKRLEAEGLSVTDVGCYDTCSVDYPDIARELCTRLLSEGYDFGVLCCGTGIGISIAANKIDGIRAAHVSDAYSAAMARAHNDANVICLGGRVLGDELAWSIVQSYMASSFQGGRHQKRVDKIADLEKGVACDQQ